jgi:hypothetical protein
MQLDLDTFYSATTMSALVCGTPMSADGDGNTCDLDGIASPDNVASIPEYNQLLIGEDTSGHQVCPPQPRRERKREAGGGGQRETIPSY